MKPGNCVAKGFKTTMKKERKATWKKYPKILVQFLMRAFPTYILVLKLKASVVLKLAQCFGDKGNNCKKPRTKILPVVNVGSLENRSNQLKY